MPIMPSTAQTKAVAPKRFSLVPESAQQEMYKALSALRSAREERRSGAEVAEIAVCTALSETDPVILACPAMGARIARKGSKAVGSKGDRWAQATIAAVTSLLDTPAATVLICAGQLDAGAQEQKNWRNAFAFAARHRLPILFLIANECTLGRPQELDLRPLYAEFGIPVFSVDANDSIAAYRIATEALHNARQMRGPCVIEALSVKGGSNAADSIDLLRDYMERHGNIPDSL